MSQMSFGQVKDIASCALSFDMVSERISPYTQNLEARNIPWNFDKLKITV